MRSFYLLTIVLNIFLLVSCDADSQKEDRREIHKSDDLVKDKKFRSADYLNCSKIRSTEGEGENVELVCSFELGSLQANVENPEELKEELKLVKSDIVIENEEGKQIEFTFKRLPDDKFSLVLNKDLVEPSTIGILTHSGYQQSKGEIRKVSEILAYGSKTIARSGCYISQNTCTVDYSKTGTFLDDHESITDYMSCLARALTYHDWCNNPSDAVTKAEFFDNGTLVDQATHTTPINGCYIEQSECTLHPEHVSFLRDTQEDAHTDKEICLKRALDFNTWCGNPETVISTARFYENKKLVEEHSHNAPFTGCYIEQAHCEKQPSLTGTFLDFDLESHTDEVKCMIRAGDYHSFCENSPELITSAKFYKNRIELRKGDQNTPIHGCFIEQKACKNAPEKVGLFPDEKLFTDDEPGNASQAQCMERAVTYSYFCQNPNLELTTAKFYQDMVVIEEITHSTPRNGCYITQDSCVNFPDRIGTFKDRMPSSHESKEACLLRGEQYQAWCDNPDTVKTNAGFYIDRLLQ